VGAEVQREVEGRDTEDGPAREAPGQPEAAGAAEVRVEPLCLAAVEAAGFLGGEPEHGHGPADLATGPLDRLAVLRRDQLGDLLGALRQPPYDVVERGSPYVRRGGRELVAYGMSGGDGLLDLGVGRHADGADQASVVRVGDVEAVGTGGLAAGHPEGVGRSHGGSGPSEVVRSREKS
jgi:hypothetical protein